MPIIGSLQVTQEQYLLLTRDLELILDINKIHNLTRIDSFESGMLLHIEDSLSGLPEFNEAPTGAYADLGTGGGFPGIPFSIMCERECLLVDSIQKKVKALETVIQDLGLQDRVFTYAGRIEDLALEKPEYFSVLSARALSALPSLLELASPLLKIGGHFICFKAQVSEEELQHCKTLENKLGMKCISRRDFQLSDGETHRCILVFKKWKQAQVKLPRRVGLAQKKPY